MKIGVIGGGQMGYALVGGIVRSTVASASAITVCDIDIGARSRIADAFGVNVTDDATVVTDGPHVVVIALKPQVIASVISPLADRISSEQTIVSIAAGIPTARIELLLRSSATSPVHVVRAMPNTPALIGLGITALCGGKHTTATDFERAEAILGAVGKTVRVTESQMDAVTGLSGSGPAFVYVVIEALADGGVRAGLSKELALQLATQTVLGAAHMVAETGEHPAVLRDRVTSAGGTTIAGIDAAEAAGLRHALMSAVSAAAKRSAELSS
jgi:pyrroline-5-carboxylate reductase